MYNNDNNSVTIRLGWEAYSQWQLIENGSSSSWFIDSGVYKKLLISKEKLLCTRQATLIDFFQFFRCLFDCNFSRFFFNVLLHRYFHFLIQKKILKIMQKNWKLCRKNEKLLTFFTFRVDCINFNSSNEHFR